MAPANRKELVAALVRYELPIEPVLDRLVPLGWDCDDVLVWIGADEVIAILDRYLRNELSGEQVGRWADLIEVRDDIGIVSRGQSSIREILFRLANPDLGHEPNADVAEDLRTELLRLATGVG